MASLAIAIDARRAKAGAEQFDRAVDKVDKGARRADGAVRGLDGKLRDARGRFVGAGRGAESFGRKVRKARLESGLLGTLLGRIVAPLAAIATVGKSLGLAAEAEKTRIAFTTMLGDQTKALNMLKEIEQFAASTPFQFQGLASTVRLTLALGTEAEKAVPRVKTIADAVSALGGNDELMRRVVLALGQMEAKGKVSAEEMRQLAEAGIPSWEILANAIGVGIPEAMKMAERGVISGSQGVEAILAGMNQRFAGSTEALAQTTAGLWSTFKDNVSFALRDVGAVLIETFDIPNLLRNATQFVKTFVSDFRQMVDILRGVDGAYENASESAQFMALMLEGVNIAARAYIGLKLANAVIGASNAFLKFARNVEFSKKALAKSVVGIAAVVAIQFVPLDKILGDMLSKMDQVAGKAVNLPSASDPNDPRFTGGVNTAPGITVTAGATSQQSQAALRMLSELKAEREALGLTNVERAKKLELLRLESLTSKMAGDEAAKLIEQYAKEFDALQRGLRFREAGEVIGQGFGQGFIDAFDTILERGRITARELRDIFQSMISDIARGLFQRLVVNRIVDSIAAGIGGLGNTGNGAGTAAGDASTGAGLGGAAGNFGKVGKGAARSTLGGGDGGQFFGSSFNGSGGGGGDVYIQVSTNDVTGFNRSKGQIAQDMRRAQRR